MTSMASHAPKIWMNVTTSANWHRAVVGIVRVERELARELSLLLSSDEFGLCIFQDGKFIPYEGSPVSTPSRPLQPVRHNNRHVTFPRSTSFEPSLRNLKSRAQELPAANTPAHTPTNTSTTFERGIRHGDTLVSVGLDWDYPYINQFQFLKERMGVKIVTCCYDLIPVLFPQYCVGSVSSQFKDYFTKLSWASSLILCISKQSRADYQKLAKMIGAPEADTIVMPLGDNVPDMVMEIDDQSTVDDAPVDALSAEILRAMERPFILFVSTIERRKNHEVLYRAYHLLARAGHGSRLPRLVFVGMPGWGVSDLLNDIEFDPVTQDLIIQLNHVTDHELNLLYERAYFCVYPSLYEGWGLPVGEALARGKAVIASAEGSIPEVGGNLVTYLDPWSPKAWAEEILALVDDPKRVQAMELAVRNGYQIRTWKDTAEAVKAALDRLRIVPPASTTLYPGYDLETKVGTPWGEEIRSGGAAGLLTFGPHRSLAPGRYDVCITIDKFEGDAGKIHISLRSGKGQKEHGAIKITLNQTECLIETHIFPVTLRDFVEDYEIYSEISSGTFVSIKQIDIRHIQYGMEK